MSILIHGLLVAYKRTEYVCMFYLINLSLLKLGTKEDCTSILMGMESCIPMAMERRCIPMGMERRCIPMETERRCIRMGMGGGFISSACCWVTWFRSHDLLGEEFR